MKKVKLTRVVPPQPETSVEFVLTGYTHDIGTQVRAVVGEQTEEGVSKVTGIALSGGEYLELLSDKPVWAKNKPKDSFRPEDILSLLMYKNLI